MQLNRRLEISGSVGFGMNGVNDKATILTAIRAGYRLFDSAELYGNAKLLAEAIQESGVAREEFFINYKIYPKMSIEKFILAVDLVVEYFSYVDCIMLHDVYTDEYRGYDKDKFITILKALEDNVKAGKVRSLGLSNCDVGDLREWTPQFPDIKLVQNAFNHTEQDVVVRNFCRQNDLVYMGYEIFGGREIPAQCSYQFQNYKSAWNVSSITYPALLGLAEKHGKTPHEIILCWAIQQGTVQIPSSSNPKRIADNLALVEFAKSMSDSDKNDIAAALQDKVLPETLEQIKVDAQQGNNLAKLKLMVGNNLLRQRLLEVIYQDDKLKYFIDLLNSRIDLLYPDKSRRREANRNEYILSLCHFMEECLRVSDKQYVEMIRMLDFIAKNSHSDMDKDRIIELLEVMYSQQMPSTRMNKIKSYYEQLDYFNQNGFFEIKQLYFPGVDEVKVAFLRPNNKIYILNNIPWSASLLDVKNFLAEYYPEDFNNTNLLESFYNGNSPYIDGPLDNFNFHVLQYSPGFDIYAINGLEDCVKMMSFFHSPYKHPNVYTG